MNIRNRVTLTVENQVAQVQLQRPEKHNALDLEMFRAIAEAQHTLATQREVRAVILAGSGVDFCTGLDIKSIMQDRSSMIKLLWKWSGAGICRHPGAMLGWGFADCTGG